MIWTSTRRPDLAPDDGPVDGTGCPRALNISYATWHGADTVISGALSTHGSPSAARG